MASSTVMDVGARCSAQSCNLIAFLPITCPTCSFPFCSPHIHSDLHPCFKAQGQAVVLGRFEERAKCPVDGCNGRTLESAGNTKGYNGGAVSDIGKMIRCQGCKIAFCVIHREQKSHQCSAATPEELADQAKTTRQAVARAAIAAAIPGRQIKAIPKPPAGKLIPGLSMSDKLAKMASASKLPTSIISPNLTSSTEAHSPAPTSVSPEPDIRVPYQTSEALVSPASISPQPSARDQKLAQIRLMKLKSRAEPLHPAFARSKILPEEMAFFEYLWDPEGKQVEKLDDKMGKLEVGWVAKVTTIGKVLDLLAAKLNLIHKPSQTDTSQNLYVLKKGGTSPLDTSKAIGDVIEQGGRVIIVRGEVWRDGAC